MTMMPEPPAEPDEAKCQQVYKALQKVMETDRPTIEWATAELANHLNSALRAAYTSVAMQLMRRGIPKEEAEKSAQQQLALLALDLGMRIGSEMAGADQLRNLLGDDFGKGFDL